MRSRWARGMACATLGCALALVFAVSASAMSFTSTPPLYSSSSAGPFAFKLSSGSTDQDVQGVAWNFTGAGWHRCDPVLPGLTFADLAEGRYSLSVADDYDKEYFNNTGRGLDPRIAPCHFFPGDPPPTAITTYDFVVDGSPPDLTLAFALVGSSAQLTVTAGDAMTGIAAVSVNWGDGTTQPAAGQAGAQTLTHAYKIRDRYTIDVTATDLAGNEKFSSLQAAVSSKLLPESVKCKRARALLKVSQKKLSVAQKKRSKKAVKALKKVIKVRKRVVKLDCLL